MTLSPRNRRTAGIIAALALGIAAPAAGAKPFDAGPVSSDGPKVWPQTPATSVQAPASHHAGGGTSDWEYVAIGTGVASFALISVGGTRAATRRRRRERASVRPTIAA